MLDTLPSALWNRLPFTRTMAGKAVYSAWYAHRHSELLDQVERYCMFVGYPRSGHTLTGSLLTAHPDIVISHERDVLQYLPWGFTQRQLFSLILQRDREFTERGRSWTGFQYVVKDQWQGRTRRLRVIGDKKGGQSSLRLYDKPSLLDSLRSRLTVPIRVIHQTRNPYDNISTMNRRAPGEPLKDTIDWYFRHCESVRDTRSRLSKEELIDLRYEDLIERPQAVLKDLCRFLEVEENPCYIEACASLIHDSAHQSRHETEWPEALVEEVRDKITMFEFLSGYSFEE